MTYKMAWNTVNELASLEAFPKGSYEERRQEVIKYGYYVLQMKICPSRTKLHKRRGKNKTT